MDPPLNHDFIRRDLGKCGVRVIFHRGNSIYTYILKVEDRLNVTRFLAIFDNCFTTNDLLRTSGTTFLRN